MYQNIREPERKPYPSHPNHKHHHGELEMLPPGIALGNCYANNEAIQSPDYRILKGNNDSELIMFFSNKDGRITW